MKLEEQLLPHKDLKPLYGKAVWVYVYRTFQKDDADRLAERISLRFGVTSWPQLILVDPVTLTITRHAGRTVASFEKAFEAARLTKAPSETEIPRIELRLTEAEELAIKLRTKGSLKLARASILSDDSVVRTRALEVLAEKAPKDVVKRADALLAVPSDPFRYLVCKVLTDHPDPKANDALEALVETPAKSLNPNVLRIRAVQALTKSGDAGSVAVIAPHATSGVYFNGLTGIAVDALAVIAKRHKDARKAVRTALLTAYPEPPANEDARKQRACVGLAKRVHKALGSKLPFPSTYDAKGREALMREKP